jgi:hypothetical protein
VKSVTHNLGKTAYVCRVALEHRTRATRFLHSWRNAMLSFDSYREVLSEHARSHHIVKSAWFVVLALAVFFVVFG